MKKLTLTKETIRDLSKPELDDVAGGGTVIAQGCTVNTTSWCYTVVGDPCGTTETNCLA